MEEEDNTMTNNNDNDYGDNQHGDNANYDNGDENDEAYNDELEGTTNTDKTDDNTNRVTGWGGAGNGVPPPLLIPEHNVDQTSTIPAPTNYFVPSLRGRLICEGNSSICRGLWAMSDSQHSQPGQTSEFEFKLTKPAPDTKPYPLSGTYQGWFHLKHPPPKQGQVKIEEKDLNINFAESNDGAYTIQGTGHNKFGTFTLKGTLTADGMIQMYRQYTTVLDKRKSTNTPKAKTPRATPGANEVADGFPTVTQQRDGAGRVRKQSNLMKEKIESMSPRATSTPKANPSKQVKSAAPAVVVAPVVASSKIDSSRIQRTSAPMLKCMDILKEMLKFPPGIYFKEPVDYVRLQIPDYPNIITNPMDFSTIKGKLDASIYNTPEQFADDMRLIFRNATTYNADREHVVHKAARDCQSRFEDRFRALMKQLTQNTQVFVDDAPFKAKIKGPKGPKVSGKPQGRPSFSNKQTPYLAPALDTQTQLVIDMKRKMEEMEKQMHEMQSQLKKNEIKSVVEEKRQAAQNPLSAEDKRILLSKIERLPEEKMAAIVDIVKDAIPVDGSNTSDQVEIELDKLDTLTLRKLQKFVDGENRKRPATGNVGRPAGSVAKKPRANAPKAKAKVAAKTTSFSHPLSTAPSYDNIPPPPIPFEDDALLFNPDSFEDMREGADGEHSDDENDGEEQGSDPNQFNESAWLKAPPVESSSNSSSSSSSNQWDSAAAEVISKRERENFRKNEEERLVEARRLEESNKSAMLAREHYDKQQQKKNLEQQQKENEHNKALLLQQQREEERLQRESRKQTVSLEAQDIPEF